VDRKREVIRPVTLYVDRVQTKDIEMPDVDVQRVVALDLEMRIHEAKALMEYLQKRIEEGRTPGIRVRLEGHLVHS